MEIGGTLGDFTTYASCQPLYKINEYVIVFLKKEGNYYRTYGLNQGKFNIRNIDGVAKKIIRKINVDELIIPDSNIKREDIKSEFSYSDITVIISQNL